ncbi:MAG TPA: nucleotidyltransferase domain-containing protein [Anaerolineae bacterium]|nr:nucleotidyltransferase domain-containing protein [Anaerolineae bacterium]
MTDRVPDDFGEKMDENVKFAYLFGSQAAGKAAPLSDVDIAVYLDDKANTLYLTRTERNTDKCKKSLR